MWKQRRIKRFLCALFDRGGELTRGELLHDIFHGNLTKNALDKLLASPELSELFITNRAPRRDRCGQSAKRNATRYCLTIAGWNVLLAGPRHGRTPRKLNTEAVQEHFQQLLAECDVWATQLNTDAQNGRQREEAWLQQRAQALADRKEQIRAKAAEKAKLRAEKEATAAKAREAKEAREHPDRMPSLPTFGSEAHIGAAQPSAVDQPAAGSDRPAMTPAVAFRESVGWPRYIAPVRDTLENNATSNSKLVAKIKAAGYQVNGGGQVLFDGKWIDAAEWRRRMPGVLD